jgi:hypothetical protein
MEDLRPLIWIPIALLLLAVLPLPYGYYMFLRLVMPVCALVVAVNAYKTQPDTIYSYVFIGMAILYNPLIPISLFKEIWIVVNLITAGVFYIYQRTLK